MIKKTNKKQNLFGLFFKQMNFSFLKSSYLGNPSFQKTSPIFSIKNSGYEMDKNSNENAFNRFNKESIKSKTTNSKINNNKEIFNESFNTETSLNAKKFSYKEKFTTTSSRAAQSRFNENSKQQVVSITYEEIGLFPRSFNRVFDRFFKQLFFDVENLVIQEYRFYRYLFLTTVKCVFILLFVPLTMNFIAKNYFVRPITEYYWNSHQTDIFLNSYQQKKAFTELKNFEEKIYFESLIFQINSTSTNLSCFSESLDENKRTTLKSHEKKQMSSLSLSRSEVAKERIEDFRLDLNCDQKHKNAFLNVNINEQEKMKQNQKFSQMFTESIQNRLQLQTIELAKHYNEESIEAITNFFADFISLSTLFILLKTLEIQINITKSFLLEVFFGLDDSKKSLLILFLTDLLVGYHSPNIWELFFSTIFDHYGLPESQTTIFLLVATLPVLLDVLFKYLIFRHLNRASPATVATYHAMIE
uniref:Potassium/proton antiporter CemA n=1 Tax=Stauridium tetras TaxID=271398 RepID=A0A2U8GK21_9CHLO|nr:chloroplast envelope membrane protein [Stauridium tetras]AWI68965.1 chloroplast envelope membrane protein [Stauridium tetras]